MRLRKWTVLAQDPTFTRPDGKPLLAEVTVPEEPLLPGPRGHRVQVIDYDPALGRMYQPRTDGLATDPYKDHSRQTVRGILADPQFHAQNVYAITMSTLMHFESALGRSVDWAFTSKSPQIKIAPHGLAEPNAFYSRDDEALVFGYFPHPDDRDRYVFSCLSHDVIAHETAHAVLDGLRPHFLRPSSPDQSAFHEGFADIVALLSLFRLEPIVENLLNPGGGKKFIPFGQLHPNKLKESALVTLAREMGHAMWPAQGRALRESATLKPSRTLLHTEEFQYPHRRGEVLVAAILNAFLRVWHQRVERNHDIKNPTDKTPCNMNRVVEEGAKAALHLLNISIRALDYIPPIDLTFNDYLTALITADRDLVPDDSRHGYRRILLKSFEEFGIFPAGRDNGYWLRYASSASTGINRFSRLQRDPNEVFKFLWHNAREIGLSGEAFTAVETVRPLIRLGPDGASLRETVATYVQILDLIAFELKDYGISLPEEIPGNTPIRLQGGGTIVFDEFGQCKYHIGEPVTSSRQAARILYQWNAGFHPQAHRGRGSFAALHRERARGAADVVAGEVW